MKLDLLCGLYVFTLVAFIAGRMPGHGSFFGDAKGSVGNIVGKRTGGGHT